MKQELKEALQELIADGVSKLEILEHVSETHGDEQLLVVAEALKGIAAAKPATSMMKPVKKITAAPKPASVDKAGAGADDESKSKVDQAGVKESVYDPHHNAADVVDYAPNTGDVSHWYHESVIAGKYNFPSPEDAYASYCNWNKTHSKDPVPMDSFKGELESYLTGLKAKRMQESMSLVMNSRFRTTVSGETPAATVNRGHTPNLRIQRSAPNRKSWT